MKKSYKNKNGKKVIIKKMDDTYLTYAYRAFKKQIRTLNHIYFLLKKFSKYIVVRKMIKVLLKDLNKTNAILYAINKEIKDRR